MLFLTQLNIAIKLEYEEIQMQEKAALLEAYMKEDNNAYDLQLEISTLNVRLSSHEIAVADADYMIQLNESLLSEVYQLAADVGSERYDQLDDELASLDDFDNNFQKWGQ